MSRKIFFLIVYFLTLQWSMAPAAFSQSFSDLNDSPDSTESTTTANAVIMNPQLSNEGYSEPQKRLETPLEYDPGQTPENELKQVMNPKEYEQFMAAKRYSDKNSTYTLGPTDVIEINVLRHPEVSGKYILNMEGKIQYEFVGDVILSGMTKEQAGELITKTLSTYIVNPQVTVKISEYNSKIVYVVGEVAHPGRIIMRGDTITVREALLEAGLPLLTANTTHSTMFTPTAGKVKRRIVDVYALLFKGDLRQNYIMKPGDTLYVPPTFWAKATRVISPVAQPIGQAASTGATVTTGIP